ncbi:MAG: TfoX/Sxy family protein [Calditrichaeota bacterium]|nr:TfoX/Sxy family protein [Calditrichota bacterium]
MEKNKMAKLYLEKLTELLETLKIRSKPGISLEIKHLFSGAALYTNGVICASWSPVGLAFKLPDRETEELITIGKASPLKYFPQGHIKKGYALFESPNLKDKKKLKSYFQKAIKDALEKG